MTISETRPFPTASVRVFTSPTSPILTWLSHAHSAQPTPAPTPVCVGRGALAPLPRSAPRCLPSPPRAASAPRSPRRRLQPGCRATPPRPPPPASPPPAFPMANTPALPPPPSPPPAARPLDNRALTHGRAAASAQAQEPELEHRRRPALAAGPSPGSRRGLPDRPAGGGGVGAATAPHSPGSRQPIPVPLWGEPLPRSSLRRPSSTHNLGGVGSRRAVLTRPARRLRRRAPSTARPSSAGVRSAPARGGRAAHLRVPLTTLLQRLPGDVVFQLVLWRLWRLAGNQWRESGVREKVRLRRWAVNDKGWRVMLE